MKFVTMPEELFRTIRSAFGQMPHDQVRPLIERLITDVEVVETDDKKPEDRNHGEQR